ncbi:hypothetical protein [Frankia sp. Cj5]|uniref:hypothetical protein n=1 Tax=Frankia sp. Cj5 TaxID=2880978 RepID=UPI001EF53FB8|nr:hypothetical protein [Frankia sp. Cj5]
MRIPFPESSEYSAADCLCVYPNNTRDACTFCYANHLNRMKSTNRMNGMNRTNRTAGADTEQPVNNTR